MEGQIPVIDLHEFELQPQKLRETSEKWGCFRLVNHGVPTKLMADMKEVAKDLLGLPVEIKKKNKDVLFGTGYMAPSERNPLYEAFGLFDGGCSQAVSSFCSNLQVSPQQRETIQMYTQAICKLAVDLAEKMGKSMGLAGYCFDEWPCMFRFNKYTFTEESLGSFGIPIHRDVGLLTILQEDEKIGGLEVMDPSGKLVAVNPWPGTFLVILGDMAVPWSNGRLLNVRHHVQCKDVGLRHTIATFISPPAHKVLETPAKFVDAEHPRLYSPFTYEEYRNLRFPNNLQDGEVLELLRVQTIN